MKVALTSKLVQSLGPGLYWDRNPAGFGLRVTPNLVRSYIFNYSLQGRERRLTIGGTNVWSLVAARAEAMELRRAIDKGEDPLGGSLTTNSSTMDDLVERFSKEEMPTL